MYSGEDEETRRVLDPKKLVLHSAYHNESGRRQHSGSGGFCEVRQFEFEIKNNDSLVT